MRWFTKAPLQQQLIGLEALWREVPARAVLDVGCAEGLIGLQCLKHGAAKVVGIDNRPDAVKEANSHSDMLALVRDAQEWQPPEAYDIVLMLGVIHKLQKPAQAFARYLDACIDLALIRLPRDCWPVLVDSRSGSKPIALDVIAAERGFGLERFEPGPKGQFVGYLRRMN